MARKPGWAIALAMLTILSCAAAQDAAPSQDAVPKSSGAAHTNDKAPPNAGRAGPEQKFVLDTVKMAVALPESDPQDRLRVLATAAEVISTIDRTLAKGLWKEGVQIELELVRTGQTPVVSMMASGQADCAAALHFAENVPVDSVLKAEQALIGSMSSCPKQTLDPISRKLEAALENHIVAPRALMAAMEAKGPHSAWSQSRFDKMFSSLPDPKENGKEAENFAAMYARMSSEVDQDAARRAGIALLEWLGKLDDGPQRSAAITIANGAMQQALGEQSYREALQTSVSANAVVQSNAGRTMSPQHAPDQAASALEAIANNGTDQTSRLHDLPPADRARAAAAHGFAEGVGGDRKEAEKYFDLAFGAVDEVWAERKPEENAPAVVQEVSEAAAQVDSVNALERAQHLRDSAAQAIAMLAVARVVASNSMGR